MSGAKFRCDSTLAQGTAAQSRRSPRVSRSRMTGPRAASRPRSGRAPKDAVNPSMGARTATLAHHKARRRSTSARASPEHTADASSVRARRRRLRSRRGQRAANDDTPPALRAVRRDTAACAAARSSREGARAARTAPETPATPHGRREHAQARGNARRHAAQPRHAPHSPVLRQATHLGSSCWSGALISAARRERRLRGPLRRSSPPWIADGFSERVRTGRSRLAAPRLISSLASLGLLCGCADRSNVLTC